jgi:hypothetical protein
VILSVGFNNLQVLGNFCVALSDFKEFTLFLIRSPGPPPTDQVTKGAVQLLFGIEKEFFLDIF